MTAPEGTDTLSWADAAPLAAVPPTGMLECEVAGRALLLLRVNEEIFATAAICPHHAAWLSQGRIDGDAIDCPRHMGRFDIATGRKLRGPDCPDLATYATRLVAGRIQVGFRRKT